MFLSPFYRLSLIERSLALPIEGVELSQPPHLAPVLTALFRLYALESIASFTQKHISFGFISGVVEVCKNAVVELEKSGAKESKIIRENFDVSNQSFTDELVDKYKKIKAGQFEDIRFS